MTFASDNSRLHYLDAVRAFALILGIVFHASISFMPIFIGWAVMDVSTSSIVSIFMMVSHSFRMELFFLIAGIFGHMTLHRIGMKAFVKSRIVRIAIPFALGWTLLRPLLVSGWIMGGESMRGEPNILGSLTAGFAVLGAFPNDLFVGTHLWFLYYLLLITATVLTFRSLIGKHEPARRKLVQAADAIARWLGDSRLSILALAVPTAGCLWYMSHWGMDTPDRSLVPHLPVTLVYGGFFLFGWFLHRQESLVERFARLAWGKISLCLLAIVATALLADFEREVGHPHYAVLKAAFALSYSIMMWSLVSLTIGLFRRFFDRPGQVVRYVADSSYWLYLIHLPIIIWLQIAFAELPIHWAIKLAAIVAITLGVSILLYDAFVRSTFVGATLNGKRKRRRLLAFAERLSVKATAEQPPEDRSVPGI